MRFDHSKSVDYNYEVGYLEGLQLALQLMIGSPSLEASLICVTQEVKDQVEVVKDQMAQEESA